MKVTNIRNNHQYTQCTHYFKSSNKYLKSMRIANSILKQVYPEFKFIHCEAIFPRIDSNYTIIEKLKVKIVTEKLTGIENRIYFSFII